jgi:PKD repeat protein
MRSYVLVVMGLTGCLKPDLVECSDGTLCPSGTTCDVENATCIDAEGLSVAPGEINLGSVGCGMSSSQVALPISNFGIAPIDVRLSSTVVGVKVTPEEATIAPHETLHAMVEARGASESIPGTPIEGSVVITSAHELIARTIRFETTGAIATANDVDFGEAFSGTSTTSTLLVRNTGNSPFTVTPTLTNAAGVFSLITTASILTVEPDHSVPFTLQFAPALANVGTFTGSVMLAYTGAMCQQPTTSVTVDGTSSGDVVIVDHTKLDFGTSACSAPAQDITLTLANRSPTPQTVTLDFSGPNSAAFSSLPGLTIPAGSAAVAISVSTNITRLAIPAKSPLITQVAQLKVGFKEANVVKILDVQSVIAAPVLMAEVDKVDFGTVAKSQVVTKTVQIINTGTLGTVTISPAVVTAANGAKLTVSPTTFQIPRATTVPITFTFTAGSSVSEFPETTFTLNSPGQCSPPPTIIVNATTGLQSMPPIILDP